MEEVDFPSSGTEEYSDPGKWLGNLFRLSFIVNHPVQTDEQIYLY